MGLLYILPCSEKETERIQISAGNTRSITLKSYGLPKIFWAYLLASLFIVALMAIAIKDPMIKLFNSEDLLNKWLVILVLTTLILIPLTLFAFFLYEKRITKSRNNLFVGHYFLSFPIRKKKYTLSPTNSFYISQFRGTPNIAREKNNPQMRAFENKGYFELFGCLENGKTLFLDRNNRKADLVKISNLLNSY